MVRCYFMQRTVRPIDGEYKYYPCGRCVACRKSDATAWGIRNYFESLSHKNNIFVSLSYAPEYLPKSNLVGYSGNLVQSDFQEFIHKLRNYYDHPIRYFGSGEYGEHGGRPHYHILIFGAEGSSRTPVVCLQVTQPSLSRRSQEVAFLPGLMYGLSGRAFS